MVGLAFCVGLVLGLLCHLPGVSSPLRARREERAAGGRALLATHDPDTSPAPGAGQEFLHYSEAHDISEKIQRSHSSDYLREGSEKLDLRLPAEKAKREGGRSGVSVIVDTGGGGRPDRMAASRRRGNAAELADDIGGQTSNSGAGVSVPNMLSVTLDVPVLRLGTGDTSHATHKDNTTLLLAQLSDVVVQGVYWSPQAELLAAPKGVAGGGGEQWRDRVAQARVVGVAEGCGRMQNRKLVLEDNTLACGRYRINQDQIQGEIYSYYLSRVLDISHVLPPVLAIPDSQHRQWTSVRRELNSAQWHSHRPVVLTPWLEHLVPAYIPTLLRQDNRTLDPTSVATVLGHSSTDAERIQTLSDLIQWSDLLLFDYLTGNVDRVVNNLYNQQWNPDMMNSPAHNLERDPDTGMLVFLDNESGLFHSYRLLDKYDKYHKSLLGAVCVFRRSTVEKLRSIQRQGELAQTLRHLLQEEEPLHQHVAKIPAKNAQILQTRVADVLQQIKHCESIHTR